MFTFRARLCFETFADPRCLSSWCCKKMCQQTCHTHLQCQLPGKAEWSPIAQGFRCGGCPAPTCPCQEPGYYSFLLYPLTSHLSPLSQSELQLCIFHVIFPSSPSPTVLPCTSMLISSRPSQTALCWNPFQVPAAFRALPRLLRFKYKAPRGLPPASSALFIDICLSASS